MCDVDGCAASKMKVIMVLQAIDSLTVDYVLFRDGLKCNSELGRTGGEQVINLNRYQIEPSDQGCDSKYLTVNFCRGCFSDGLMTTVHELLHTLGTGGQNCYECPHTWH